MIRFVAFAALAIGGWTAVQTASAPTPRPALDKLVTQMADPALSEATPGQMQAAMGGSIRFAPAPTALSAPSCAVTLPIQPDSAIADGIAGFASDPADGACATPRLRHLALRLTTGDFTQTHVVDLLRGELGAPDESEETADGATRVSWIGTDRALYVEYDPKSPETAALYLIKRPAVAAL